MSSLISGADSPCNVLSAFFSQPVVVSFKLKLAVGQLSATPTRKGDQSNLIWISTLNTLL
jgi:hypothetical protein